MAEHAYLFQLAQVCKSWRRLALSCTSLRKDITIVCPSCDAVHFPGERNATSTNSSPHDGKVNPSPLPWLSQTSSDDDEALAELLANLLPTIAALSPTTRQWTSIFLINCEAWFTAVRRACRSDILYNDDLTHHMGPLPFYGVGPNTQNCLTSGILGLPLGKDKSTWEPRDKEREVIALVNAILKSGLAVTITTTEPYKAPSPTRPTRPPSCKLEAPCPFTSLLARS